MPYPPDYHPRSFDDLVDVIANPDRYSPYTRHYALLAVLNLLIKYGNYLVGIIRDYYRDNPVD